MMDRTKKPVQASTPTATGGHSLEGSTLAFNTELPSADELVDGIILPKKFAENVADALRLNPARLSDVRNSLLNHADPLVVSSALHGVAEYDKDTAVKEAQRLVMRASPSSPGAYVKLDSLSPTAAAETLDMMLKSDKEPVKRLGEHLREVYSAVGVG